jgi:hypothetical protein
MASLQLSVFSNASSTAAGDVLQEEVVNISNSSVQSNVIVGSNNYRVVRMYADVDCFVTWGSDPTALSDGTDGRFIGANNPEYFRLQAGEKVATIERV